jgi:hypothetical protein
MTITALPVAPSRADPSTFADRGDALIAALPTFINEVNAEAEFIITSTASPGAVATSTTSTTIATGSKTITVQTGKSFVPGMEVVIAVTASASANKMIGTVTDYVTGTGALTVNVSSMLGSGTYAAWSVSMTVAPNFDGRTYTDLRLAGKITETVYTLAGTVINPTNGSIQTKTLAANTTFTESVSAGQSVLLLITAGVYLVTWPACNWVWGSAPTLPVTGAAVIIMFKVGSTLYGVYAGPA